jgi:hypothetical protein
MKNQIGTGTRNPTRTQAICCNECQCMAGTYHWAPAELFAGQGDVWLALSGVVFGGRQHADGRVRRRYFSD